MNLRDKIFSAKDITVSPVEVPEWGCTVFVKTLSAGDALAIHQNQSDDVQIVVLGCVDENGKRIFSDEDVERLKAEKSGSAVSKVAKALILHNGLDGSADVDAKKN